MKSFESVSLMKNESDAIEAAIRRKMYSRSFLFTRKSHEIEL